MSDPTLAKRLTDVNLPFRVMWGESDRIVTPEYGRAYAAAIPMATFTPLPRTGHIAAGRDARGAPGHAARRR
ncbi:alpha/beta fold hydrolase [Streptomyces chartreusis]|uniref:alpha/beta fold hydrolase n=1 Tax=Streptomyces chartreusis TaxID=1969 RepID=UPI0036C00265